MDVSSKSIIAVSVMKEPVLVVSELEEMSGLETPHILIDTMCRRSNDSLQHNAFALILAILALHNDFNDEQKMNDIVKGFVSGDRALLQRILTPQSPHILSETAHKSLVQRLFKLARQFHHIDGFANDKSMMSVWLKFVDHNLFVEGAFFDLKLFRECGETCQTIAIQDHLYRLLVSCQLEQMRHKGFNVDMNVIDWLRHITAITLGDILEHEIKRCKTTSTIMTSSAQKREDVKHLDAFEGDVFGFNSESKHDDDVTSLSSSKPSLSSAWDAQVRHPNIDLCILWLIMNYWRENDTSSSSVEETLTRLRHPRLLIDAVMSMPSFPTHNRIDNEFEWILLLLAHNESVAHDPSLLQCFQHNMTSSDTENDEGKSAAKSKPNPLRHVVSKSNANHDVYQQWFQLLQPKSSSKERSVVFEYFMENAKPNEVAIIVPSPSNNDKSRQPEALALRKGWLQSHPSSLSEPLLFSSYSLCPSPSSGPFLINISQLILT